MAYLPKAERRRSIIEATIELMLDAGVSAATVRAIATAMGVSPGQIHHCFDSIDELRAEAFRTLSDRVRAAVLAERAHLLPLDRVRAAVLDSCPSPQHERAQRLVRALAEGSSMSEPMRQALREGVESWTRHIQSDLELAVRDGALDAKTDCAELARGLVGLGMGNGILTQLGLAPYASERFFELVLVAARLQR